MYKHTVGLCWQYLGTGQEAAQGKRGAVSKESNGASLVVRLQFTSLSKVRGQGAKG